MPRQNSPDTQVSLHTDLAELMSFVWMSVNVSGKARVDREKKGESFSPLVSLLLYVRQSALIFTV
jgi:hypothetical protein